MKRVFGWVEGCFDLVYLASAAVIGLVLLSGGGGPLRAVAGVMALLLAGGDAFHLVPRVRVIFTGDEARLRKALGRGKQITSITMTLFYLLLWSVGVALFSPRWATIGWAVCIVLCIVRLVLCLMPQNRWTDRYPPVSWGILRNLPFFLQGLLVAALYFVFRDVRPGLQWMWLAVLLSFAFYLPVVLWANKNQKIGMLMLPKTCTYLWMLGMCLSL